MTRPPPPFGPEGAGPGMPDGTAAPAPDALPAGRPHLARRDGSLPPPPAGGTGRSLVRVAAPDLARRAQLERTRGRLVIAAFGFAALFMAVGAKLTLATLIDPTLPKLRAAPTVPSAEPQMARAAITDRNGEVLAVSLRVVELYANPEEVNDPVAAADRLITVLPNLDRERLIERLTKRTVPGSERAVEFAYIIRNLTPRQMQAVNNLGQPGFYFRPAERRFFPQGPSAAHLIGQVDVDGHGIAGVEKSFDQRLRNERGPLRLSIDIRAQVALRGAVQHAIDDFRGIGGAGVIMDVQTGEVVAMISLPDYDPSDPLSLVRRPQDRRTAGTDPTFNRATVGVYEPGSTYKLLTAAMALEFGTVQPWTGYDASRPIRYGRFQIDDFKGKNRFLLLPEIVAYSSNIASAHMAHAVGPTRHREFMQRMGQLNRLGIELPETARPLAPSAQGWRDINTMTIGFGHGISVTPLHVVTAVSALANGGILRQPTLVAQPPGVEREGVRVVSERTSEIMRKLMRLVVTDGSGKGAEVAGYFPGGKTGTAQKVGPRGGYLENKRIAAFVGAFPMNAPRYAMYVMVDEPSPNARSHGYATAGWVAAPAAGQVIRRVAPILGMVPETERAPQIQQAIAIPLQPGRPPRAPAVAGTPGAAAPGQAGGPPRATARATPAPAPTTPANANTGPVQGPLPVPTPVPAPAPLRRTEAAPPAELRLVSAASPSPAILASRPANAAPAAEAPRAAR